MCGLSLAVTPWSGFAMAVACLLVLVAVGVAWAAIPEPCQGIATSPCQDVATATQHDLWDSLAMGVTQGDEVVPGRKKKCSLCTKILQKMKAMVGEDPDEAAVAAALDKGCRVLGKLLGRFCKWVVKKKREQIIQALQDGEEPRDTCTYLGFCKT
ncbi:antimicrobial peptide NK-lysin-like isoform X2 [Cuculus canorus]|uniref:antimicrobial peptide NK-lysin-like isoform X2 n=1 Tax=Cuculus canorus TaxID=55661 RepID=UPI0023AA25E4|nr:antimicrobial peptide NK-lysin-like isoform X2 [Cuculus canorus]